MNYISKGAMFSSDPDQKYRYLLWREWRHPHDPAHWDWLGRDGNGERFGEPKPMLFIMLNPSTADSEKDDPTIGRCVNFAKASRYERIEVVNLFAYRTKSPKVLKALTHEHDPVGFRNQQTIEKAAQEAGIIVLAWGAHGGHLGQDETVLGWLEPWKEKLRMLELTKGGRPKHPLYIHSARRPQPFEVRT